MMLTFSPTAVDIRYQRDLALGPDMRRITRAVCNERGVSYDLVMGHRRFPSIVAARHEAMHRIRQDTDFSLGEIGRFFGRDHTTVLHALQKFGDVQKKSCAGAAA